MKNTLVFGREKIVFFCGYMIFVLYMFHMVRGLFFIYPLLVFFLVLSINVWAVSRTTLSELDPGGVLVIAVSIGYSLLIVPIISLICYPESFTPTSVARFLFVLPLLVLTLTFVRVDRFVRVLKFYVLFAILCGASVLYQIRFGPVSWFAEASNRDGLVRYSSLAGSLTILGVSGGLALPFAFFLIKRNWLKFIVLAAIAIGMLLSLQKAAVINLMIFAVLVFWFYLKRGRLSIIILLGGLLSGFVALLYSFDVSYAVSVVNNVFRVGQANEGYTDYSFSESILSRLWGLPSVVLNYHGPYSLIFGVGIAGGAGVFGNEDLPMSHNAFLDYLFIGGIPYLLIFLISVGYAIQKCRICIRQDSANQALHRSCLWFFLIFLANMPFASGMQFQPVLGGVFYAVLGWYLIVPKKTVDSLQKK